MNISVAKLPSGGYGYEFPGVSVSPMSFIQITKYLEGCPKDDPLEKYLYDIKDLIDEDEHILDCYLMDVDFLIFYKKLCTVSRDLSYTITITCPNCGAQIRKSINFEQHIHFKQADPATMEGARVELNGNVYDVKPPTVRQFFKVFEKYLKYRKIEDLEMIKTISLIDGFDLQGNQIENDVLGAKHEDITLLLMLKEVYFNHIEPIQVFCPTCNQGKSKEERRSIAVSVDDLIADFFRDICNNCPVDGTKILFKQVRQGG